MRTKDELDKYYENLEDILIQNEANSAFPEFFYNSFLAGNNKIYHKEISETKVFEEDWVNTLESYFPSIDRIITNPKSTIRYDNEVVDIERAKKTNAESVRHLASHTQFIREVNDRGVVPKKILTTFSEQEFGTYENRFLASLIIRLHQFVNSRYQVIKENVESFEKDHINLNSVFNISGTEVTLDIDMVIKKDQDNDINEYNKALLKRIEKLNYLINGFRNSQFIKSLEKLKRVNPPIIKTNIILKNPDYKNAYTLWLYLDKYSGLFYDVKVKEKNVDITKGFTTNVNRLALMTYTMVQNSSDNRVENFQKVEEYDVLRKKSMKTLNIHPDDTLERPEGIELEDNSINEFFLNQYKKIFNKSLDENIKTSSNYDVALRKSLRDVISISNALFDSVFNIAEENEDIFTRLVTKDNPLKDYETARKKAIVAKAIRETKEVDYQNAIRLEKRLLKEMETANNKLIKDVTLRKTEETRKGALKKLESELKNYQKVKTSLKGQIAAISKEKDEVTNAKLSIKKQLKEFNEKTKAEKARIQKTEQEKLKAQIKKLEEKTKQKIQKMLEASLAKEKAEKERLAAILAEKNAEKEAKLKAIREDIKAKAKLALEEANKKNQEDIENTKRRNRLIARKDSDKATKVTIIKEEVQGQEENKGE